MPTIMPEGIRIPAGGDSYALTADLRRMMESATTIVPVANLGARAALVAALNAAGRPPSAADPVYVDRADAPPGATLERTINGSTWTSFPSSSTWSAMTLGAGWAVVPGTPIPATRIEGDQVVVRGGRVRWAAGTAAIAEGAVVTPLTGIVPAHQAAVPEWLPSAMFLSFGAPKLCTVTFQGASVLVTPGATGTIGAGEDSHIIIPPMRWARP